MSYLTNNFYITQLLINEILCDVSTHNLLYILNQTAPKIAKKIQSCKASIFTVTNTTICIFTSEMQKITMVHICIKINNKSCSQWVC